MNELNRKDTVMIVDDTPANLGVLQELLLGEKYRVVAFPSAPLAIKALGRAKPDLILLDIMMPEMDGFEACRIIKALPEGKDVPIIFLSALSDTLDKIKAFGSGGVDYITKPFQKDEVLARIATHISMRRMQIELSRHNEELQEMVEEKVKEISDSQLSTLVAITNLSESRDNFTGKHIERTGIFCKVIAEEMLKKGLYGDVVDEEFVKGLTHAASLHDIGKIGIPDAILMKKGKLSEEEFEIMKSHTTIGAMTLQNVLAMYPQNEFISLGIELAISHHERWNGRGYPAGLAGEDIPVSGRIMALADVYDAVRSRRPYKEPFSHEKSVEIIREERGQHFDPVVVDIFLENSDLFKQISEDMKDSDEGLIERD